VFILGDPCKSGGAMLKTSASPGSMRESSEYQWFRIDARNIAASMLEKFLLSIVGDQIHDLLQLRAGKLRLLGDCLGVGFPKALVEEL
jgi:hypothetical protein